MQQRSTVRVIPRSPITVAIQTDGEPFAYGVVANISVGGACIWTDAGLEPGRKLTLRLSFPRGSQPMEAEGVVVWGEARSQGRSGALRCGLQFLDRSADPQGRLAKLISASA
jgi:uncharacterized protein (TIGR02266 family)